MAARKLVLIGFMGAGKSTAARSAAEALGTQAFDVDRVVEERLGKPVAEIFSQDGEAAFRAVEEEATLTLLDDGIVQVLALGGGAIASELVRGALGRHVVVWLDIGLDTAWDRVAGSGRPLAHDKAGFQSLYEQRQALYEALADVTVSGERLESMPEVLDAIQGLPDGSKMLWAATASSDYPAYVGPGLVAEQHFWPATVGGRRFVVTDGHVGGLYGDAIQPQDGRVVIMPGEQSKTVAHADIVWTELARAGMTREDVVVALGGGVVGDLAGFCAATYQRGVRYVQVPTTLVAQVDSAYGGKTGVDLAQAKNYVGAYHQPAAVLSDTAVLQSLPGEERASGYAEVLKTALIAGGPLWEQITAGADPLSLEVIVACARTKLRVVERDERDAGLRQVLNLGHTVGHAIETATGYARYRHGEAVGLGLLAALRLSELEDLREQVAQLLRSHGLPTRLEGTDPDAVVMATARDKKRVGQGPVPFVLLEAPGRPLTGCEVESRALIEAVRELTA